MRILILTLVLLLGWLQYRLWVGEGSLAEIHALRGDIVRQTQDIKDLRARNQALAAEVADLKDGHAALEERARMDLGMIKQGEVFVQVTDGPLAAPGPDPQGEVKVAPKSPSKTEPKAAAKPQARPVSKPAAPERTAGPAKVGAAREGGPPAKPKPIPRETQQTGVPATAAAKAGSKP